MVFKVRSRRSEEFNEAIRKFVEHPGENPRIVRLLARNAPISVSPANRFSWNDAHCCYVVCVFRDFRAGTSREREREEDKEHFTGRESWSALTFVTGLDESSAGSTVEASAASASLGHDEIYGFGSYTDMCVHRVTRKRNVPSRSHMWLRLKGLSSRDTLNRGTRSGLEFHEK